MHSLFRLFLPLALCSTTLQSQSADTRDLPGLRRQADAAFGERRYNDARALFTELTKADPSNGVYWLRLGDSEAALRNYAGAIGAIRTALEAGFGWQPSRSMQVARLYAAKGSVDSSLVWIRRALDSGYESRASIASDSAFAGLAARDDFQILVRGFARRPENRNAGWARDLEYLAAEARRLATGPNPVALTPQFGAAVERLKVRISSLDDAQVFIEMQKLVASLGSGHSVLYPVSTPAVKLTSVPIDMYQFADGVFITGGADNTREYLGYKVEKIGGLSIDSALARVKPLVPVDNRVGYQWTGTYFLNFPAMLKSVGASVRDDAITYTLRSPAGAVIEPTIPTGELRMPSKLGPPAGREPPLYLRDPDIAYWVHEIPGRSVLYVQYNQVTNRENFSIQQLADSISAYVRKAQTKTIIVDVRRNNGGNGSLNRSLIRTLIQFEGLSPSNRIVIITGRNTFSAAQNFINDADRWTNAIFAGEPSSSRPNFVGEDTELVLPWSGIAGSIGSRYFQDSDPTDTRQWIPVDISVTLTSSDYFSNTDPVLDAVLRFLSSSD